MTDRERYAGEMYSDGLKRVHDGLQSSIWMMASHIRTMLEGDRNHAGPLWRVRLLVPDGKRVELSDFKQYLLRPAREGLGFESLVQVDHVLKSEKDQGRKALAALRKEIPTWDADVKHIMKKEVPIAIGQGKHGARGKARNTPFHHDDAQGRLARLKRDRPDLAAQVVAGTISANAAAIEAGFRSPPVHWSKDPSEHAQQVAERFPGWVMTKQAPSHFTK